MASIISSAWPIAEIGYDLAEDKKRWFVTDEGITVIPKRAKI